ncbi:MAG: hydrogenase maturation protease [Candidatus Limnocylindrales bacterium]
MSGKTLVAGVGNIFLSDDAFGVEVVRRLAGRLVPEGVTVSDYGIRGIHLAYELLEGYDRLILIDAISRGGEPGTIYLLKPDEMPPTGAVADAHGMEPMAVFAYLASIGGEPIPTHIVGCEPATLDENIGLSEPVEKAVEEAIIVVLGLLGEADAVLSSGTPVSAG